MPESSENAESKEGGSKLTAMLILLVALLLLCGGIGGVLLMAGGTERELGKNAAPLGDPAKGYQVTLKYGCVTCHTNDGTRAQGPSFKGLLNSTQTYIDGSTGVVDAADVRYALREPNGRVIEGFEPQMPVFSDRITEEETVNLIAYLHSIGAKQEN